MSNPGDFAYTVKQQADIVRIVGDYVKLKKSGAQNFSGLCPFHSENTPSFSVHATRQFFHCFGCGASGDVFSLDRKSTRLNSSHLVISYAVFCLKKKKKNKTMTAIHRALTLTASSLKSRDTLEPSGHCTIY